MTPQGITLLTAAITFFGILAGWMLKRLNSLETRVRKSEQYNRRMWMWARRHVDLYYRHRVPGAPDPDPLPHDDRNDDE